MSILPLYFQVSTNPITITGAYTTLITGVGLGKYTLALNISGSFVCVVDLLVGSTMINCTAAINCNMHIDQFYNGLALCPLPGIYGSNILQYQYSGGNLSVQMYSGTTLTNCTYIISYVGVSMPTSGTSNISIDNIQSAASTNTNINSSLTTNSGRFRNIQTITTNTTLNSTYDIVNCNPSNNITITLPQSSLSTGACYSFINSSTNTITISTFTGDTIDNGSTTTATLSTQYSKLTLTNLGNGIWFSNI